MFLTMYYWGNHYNTSETLVLQDCLDEIAMVTLDLDLNRKLNYIQLKERKLDYQQHLPKFLV